MGCVENKWQISFSSSILHKLLKSYIYICLKIILHLHQGEPWKCSSIPVYRFSTVHIVKTQFLLGNSQLSTTTLILKILYVNDIYCFSCPKGGLFFWWVFSVMFTQSENTPPHKSHVTLSTSSLITISVSLASHWAFTSCLISVKKLRMDRARLLRRIMGIKGISLFLDMFWMSHLNLKCWKPDQSFFFLKWTRIYQISQRWKWPPVWLYTAYQ